MHQQQRIQIQNMKLKKKAKNLKGNERKATGKTYKRREMSDL